MLNEPLVLSTISVVCLAKTYASKRRFLFRNNPLRTTISAIFRGGISAIFLKRSLGVFYTPKFPFYKNLLKSRSLKSSNFKA